MKTSIAITFATLFLISCINKTKESENTALDTSIIPIADTVECITCRNEPQEESIQVYPTDLPERFDPSFLKTVNKFIPKGWILIDSAAGTINNDVYNDLVLIIEKDSTLNTDYITGDFGIIILSGTNNLTYNRMTVNLNSLNNRYTSGKMDGRGILLINKKTIEYSYWPSQGNSESYQIKYSDSLGQFYIVSENFHSYSYTEELDSTINNYKIPDYPLEKLSL